MDTFFPAINIPEVRLPVVSETELKQYPITKVEIERLLKVAKENTIPKEDKLPILVQKKLQKYLKTIIISIFIIYIELGYYPRQQRSAKIIVLQKLGKPDYSALSTYRLISLLNILSKLLEVVIARRLSYIAEKYGLLLNSQFSGRPGRTTK